MLCVPPISLGFKLEMYCKNYFVNEFKFKKIHNKCYSRPICREISLFPKLSKLNLNTINVSPYSLVGKAITDLGVYNLLAVFKINL